MKIKNAFLWMILLLLVATACKDKDAEKKIAALEARVSQLEGKKTPIPVTPAAEAKKPDGPLPAMTFETVDHDFGTIKEGEVVEYTYVVKNTGQADLVIQSAQPSCGCTVPDWTKDPIPVGGEGYIKAKFDSKGRTNVQNKTITVTANTFPATTTLRFKAMVTPAAK